MPADLNSCEKLFSNHPLRLLVSSNCACFRWTIRLLYLINQCDHYLTIGSVWSIFLASEMVPSGIRVQCSSWGALTLKRSPSEVTFVKLKLSFMDNRELSKDLGSLASLPFGWVIDNNGRGKYYLASQSIHKVVPSLQQGSPTLRRRLARYDNKQDFRSMMQYYFLNHKYILPFTECLCTFSIVN